MKAILQIKKLNKHLSVQARPYSGRSQCLLNWHLSIVQVAAAAVEAFQCLLPPGWFAWCLDMSQRGLCLKQHHYLQALAMITAPLPFPHTHTRYPKLTEHLFSGMFQPPGAQGGVEVGGRRGEVKVGYSCQGKLPVGDLLHSFTALLSLHHSPHQPHWLFL